MGCVGIFWFHFLRIIFWFHFSRITYHNHNLLPPLYYYLRQNDRFGCLFYNREDREQLLGQYKLPMKAWLVTCMWQKELTNRIRTWPYTTGTPVPGSWCVSVPSRHLVLPPTWHRRHLNTQNHRDTLACLPKSNTITIKNIILFIHLSLFHRKDLSQHMLYRPFWYTHAAHTPHILDTILGPKAPQFYNPLSSFGSLSTSLALGPHCYYFKNFIRPHHI